MVIFLGVDRRLRPGPVVVGLQANVKFAVEKSGGVGAVVGPAQFGAGDRDHRILDEQVADLRGELRGCFERNRVGHGGANPRGAFVKMGKEFSADERHKKKRGTENRHGHDEGDRGVIKAPVQATRVLIANPVVDEVLLFFHIVLEPIRSEHRNNRERENERADEKARTP